MNMILENKILASFSNEQQLTAAQIIAKTDGGFSNTLPTIRNLNGRGILESTTEGNTILYRLSSNDDAIQAQEKQQKMPIAEPSEDVQTITKTRRKRSNNLALELLVLNTLRELPNQIATRTYIRNKLAQIPEIQLDTIIQKLKRTNQIHLPVRGIIKFGQLSTAVKNEEYVSCHTSIDIEDFITRSDKDLKSLFWPNEPSIFRKKLLGLIKQGKTQLVLDSSCNVKNADGSCAGHYQTGEEQ